MLRLLGPFPATDMPHDKEPRGDLLCEVIQDFSMYTEAGIAEIRAAIAREDVEQLNTTARRLMGWASLVGAIQLLEVCTQFEIAAEATDRPMTHLLMSHLDGSLGAPIRASSKLLEAGCRQRHWPQSSRMTGSFAGTPSL